MSSDDHRVNHDDIPMYVLLITTLNKC